MDPARYQRLKELVHAAHAVAAPERRDRQYIDALRVAAEATHYALLPAPLLFAAARAALGGAEPETLTAVRRRLAETDGVVSLADVISEG